MKTFPGEKAAWVGKVERERGVVGERWHVYFVVHDASRQLRQWIERVRQIALDALPDDAQSLLSVVAPEFRHITCHMISLPAEEISPEQIEAFAADLARHLAGIEPFIVQMRWPVAATGSVEGDVYDASRHQPWQATSDLVGNLILSHFGQDACRYDPPPPHASIAYGAPGPDGSDAVLFDSGIIQSALRRRMREEGAEFRVGELHLLRVRQDPDRSTYQWDQSTAVRIPLGTGIAGIGDGPVAAWLEEDPRLARDIDAAGAIAGLEVGEDCAAAVLGTQQLPDARSRLAALVDRGVLAVRAGRYRLLDEPAPGNAGVRDQALVRLFDWYRQAATAALYATGNDALALTSPTPSTSVSDDPHLFIGDFDGGRGWYAAERENLPAVLAAALEHKALDACWRIAAAWCGYSATIADVPAWRSAVQAGSSAAEQSGEVSARAVFLEFEGKLAVQTGHLEDGLRLGQMALELRSASRDETGRMRSLNALGLARSRAGELAAAAELYVEAMGEADRQGIVDFQVATRINLASVQLRSDRPADAEETLRAAIALLDPDRHLALLANAQQDLGTVQARLGSLDAAVESGQDAVAVARRIGSRPHLALSLIALAETHASAGEHQRALAEAHEALAVIRHPGEPERIREILTRASHVAAAAGEAQLAAQLAEAGR